MIQIFGLKKCRNTQKAERFFRERGVGFQFINLEEKGMSKGELESAARAVGIENMIDREGREYDKAGMRYMDFDIEEVLLENPLLLKTPIVRKGGMAAAGFMPDEWKKFLL
ncbi:MAG: arsenate reductase family protein [Spirochaetales bacterium]|nr:arsenate reductase family protein [Spirochaetales bacterium]